MRLKEVIQGLMTKSGCSENQAQANLLITLKAVPNCPAEPPLW